MYGINVKKRQVDDTHIRLIEKNIFDTCNSLLWY